MRQLFFFKISYFPGQSKKYFENLTSDSLKKEGQTDKFKGLISSQSKIPSISRVSGTDVTVVFYINGIVAVKLVKIISGCFRTFLSKFTIIKKEVQMRRALPFKSSLFWGFGSKFVLKISPQILIGQNSCATILRAEIIHFIYFERILLFTHV